jgi:hypothetical protein
MRFAAFFGLLVLSFNCLASVPKGCPQTRACQEEKECKIYAFKHNCHGICQKRELKYPDGHGVQCPAQCVCEGK